jgi:3-oxosteroid 1-dehydrogenase
VRTDFVLGAAYEGPPGMVHGGLWHTADTLPELAAKIVVDADNLVSTVKRFNEFVAAGVDDDFGRGDEAYDRAFSGGRSPMVPIETAPYHAAKHMATSLQR